MNLIRFENIRNSYQKEMINFGHGSGADVLLHPQGFQALHSLSEEHHTLLSLSKYQVLIIKPNKYPVLVD